MGISWMIVNDRDRQYIPMGKKGEWSNELWRVLEFLKDASFNRATLRFVNDESEEWQRIESGYEEAYKDKFADAELLLISAQELMSASHTALFNLYYMWDSGRLEIKEKGAK